MNVRIDEQIDMDTLTSRLLAIKGLTNNPMGISIHRFGQTMAYSAEHIPGPSFNVIKGLCAEDEAQIDDILHFYEEKRIPARFEIAPSHHSQSLLKALHRRGFYQQDFHTTFYKQLTDTTKPATNEIDIRLLHQDEFPIFAEIYTEAFQMPAFLKEAVAQNNQILYSLQEWSFYLATVDHKPAGIAVLFCNEKGANLAAAATLPSFRQRGIQSALIQHRIHQAEENDCSRVVAQAAFGSSSQRNMERAGMKIAYTKAIWVKAE